MKIIIGGREQIASATLLVPDSNDAWLEFLAGSWKVKIRVTFIDDKDNPRQEFKLEGRGDHALMVIRNWNNSLPMGIDRPMDFGEVDGRKIVFLFTGYAFAGLKRLEFSFFWEAQDGK